MAYTNSKKSKESTFEEYAAGLSAAFINTSVLFPINKLIFRQMATGYETSHAYRQMRIDGYRYVYRGILPPLIQKMVSISIMFGSFNQYKQRADASFQNWHPVVSLSISSCLTGTTEAILTPLERVQMLLQDRKYHNKYQNTFDALVKLKKFGLIEYYRGLTCVLVRNGPSNILFFGFRDELKKILPHWLGGENLNLVVDKNLNQEHSLLVDFLSGAILGMSISTLFYPLSVVRTHMQTRAPGTKFVSILEAFKIVYNERDRKISRFFNGCAINTVRQFISWGIINCSYEYVLEFLHQAH